MALLVIPAHRVNADKMASLGLPANRGQKVNLDIRAFRVLKECTESRDQRENRDHQEIRAETGQQEAKESQEFQVILNL
jgi:hypothetical protein